MSMMAVHESPANMRRRASLQRLRQRLRSLMMPATVELPCHSIYALAVLRDGRLLTGSCDGLMSWRCVNGGQYALEPVCKSGNAVYALAVMGDGRVAVGSADASICIWRLSGQPHDDASVPASASASASASRCEVVITGHSDRVHALTVLHNGRLASLSDDKSIRIWRVLDIVCNRHHDAAGGCGYVCEGVLSWKNRMTHGLAALHDNRLATGRDNKIIIWRLHPVSAGAAGNESHRSNHYHHHAVQSECEVILRGHKNIVNTVTALGRERLASGSMDKTIRIWRCYSSSSASSSFSSSSYTYACEAVLEGHSHSVHCVMALRDGRLASAGDCTVRIWGREVYDHHHDNDDNDEADDDDCVGHLQLPQHHRVRRHHHHHRHRSDSDEYKCVQILRGHRNAVYTLGLLPDGRIVSGSMDKTVRVWHLSSHADMS